MTMLGAPAKPAQDTDKLLRDLFQRLAEVRRNFSRPSSYNTQTTAGLSDQIYHEELMEIYDFMQNLIKTMRYKLPKQFGKLLDLVADPRYNKNAAESCEAREKRALLLQYEFESIWRSEEFSNENKPRKDVFRFPKEDTGLARTVLIVRTQEGFQLHLQTMRKKTGYLLNQFSATMRPVSQKDPHMREGEGSQKRAKSSRRIDVPLVQSDVGLNLGVKNTLEHDTKNIIDEVKISQSYDSKHIIRMLMSDFFWKGNKKKISIICPKGIVLGKFLQTVAFKELSYSSRYQMIAGLLEGGALFNTKNVHQDIKLGNIVAFNDGEKGYFCALIDFGLARPIEGGPWPALATPGYQSPEMSAYAYYYWARHDEAYRTQEYTEAFGYQVFLSQKAHFKNKVWDPQRALAEVGKSDIKNDSWAMGIVLFEIFYRRSPTTADWPEIKKDKLLCGLLEPDRASRISLDEALKIHLSHTAELNDLARQLADLKLEGQVIPPDFKAALKMRLSTREWRYLRRESNRLVLEQEHHSNIAELTDLQFRQDDSKPGSPINERYLDEVSSRKGVKKMSF